MYSQREKYDTIFDSIRNGQKAQAIDKIKSLNKGERVGLIEYYINDLSNPELSFMVSRLIISGFNPNYFMTAGLF